MKIQILASASRDLIEGYWFYEMQAEGVGAYFLDSLQPGGRAGGACLCRPRLPPAPRMDKEETD